MEIYWFLLGLNNIYSIMNTHVNIYTMSCETGSESKLNAFIKVISNFACTLILVRCTLDMKIKG